MPVFQFSDDGLGSQETLHVCVLIKVYTRYPKFPRTLTTSPLTESLNSSRTFGQRWKLRKLKAELNQRRRAVRFAFRLALLNANIHRLGSAVYFRVLR